LDISGDRAGYRYIEIGGGQRKAPITGLQQNIGQDRERRSRPDDVLNGLKANEQLILGDR
jgi:hypothetical protein